MINAERLEDINRYYALPQVAVDDGSEPLTLLQRRVLLDMLGDLLEHARETVQA